MLWLVLFLVIQDARTDRANKVYSAWNDMSVSMGRENELLVELQENLKANPPRLVHDARRADLYELVIAEHKRQLKDFEAMREADK